MSVLSRTIAKYLRPSPYDDTIIETELSRIENTVAAFSRQADVSGRAGGLAAGLAAGNIDIGFSYGIQLRNPGTGAISVHLKPTGDAFLGQDTNDPGKTSMAVFSNGQTYNGETMGDGDFLLGDNTAGKANLLWDFSTGRLNFRGGTTVHAYVGTDGKVYAGSGAVVLSNTGIVATAGVIGGWTINATQIYKTGIILDSSLDQILVGSGTPRLLLDGANKLIKSTNFASGVSGFQIAGTSGNAEFNDIRARGEIATAVFTYNEIQATAGTLGVFKSAAVVKTAFVTPVVSGTVAVEINNSPAGGSLLAASDVVRVKTWNGSVVIDSWFTVTTVGTNYGTYTDYVLTLQSGYTIVSVPAGTAIADYGPSGSGFITLSADGAVGSSANMSIVSHTGSPWTTQTLRARLGNLNGSYGAVSSVYGVGIGDYSASNYLSYNADGSGTFVLKAGGGNIIMDAYGISIQEGTGTGSTLKWVDSANNRMGFVYADKATAWMSVFNNYDALNLDKATTLDLSTRSKATAGISRTTAIRLKADTAAGDGNYIDFQVEGIINRLKLFDDRTEVTGKFDFTQSSSALRHLSALTPSLTGVSDWPIQLIGLYSSGAGYTGGLVFATSDDNPTKPKAGIYVQNTSNGSRLHFGTSKTYATGITQEIIIDETGDIYTAPWTPYQDTSTILGWSTLSVAILRYMRLGNIVYVLYAFYGVSNDTIISFTLPYTHNGGTTLHESIGQIQDNGTDGSVPGLLTMPNGSATASCYRTAAGTPPWTASGNKAIYGNFWYYTTQAP